jgi:hypothetical protein
MTTPLRRAGALALAATTIVTGLSLGPAATASPTPDSPAPTTAPASSVDATSVRAPVIDYADRLADGKVRIVGSAPAGGELRTTDNPAVGWWTPESGRYFVPDSGRFDLQTSRLIDGLAAVRLFIPNGGPSPESNRVLPGQRVTPTYDPATDTVRVSITGGEKNANVYVESMDGSSGNGGGNRTDGHGNATFTLPAGVGAGETFRLYYWQNGAKQTLSTGRPPAISDLRVERGENGRVTVSGQAAGDPNASIYLGRDALVASQVQYARAARDNSFSFVLNDAASQLTTGYIYNWYQGVRTKITINPLTAKVDSVDVATRTARISGTAIPGAYVVINDDDEVQATPEGTWTYDLTGLNLRKNTVSLQHFENGVRTRSTTLEVDLAIRDVTATTSFPADTTQPAVLSGAAHPSATIIVRDATGTEIARTQASGSGTWTTPIPAPDTDGDYPLQITQEITGQPDPAGPTNVTVAYGAAVAITMPVEDMAHDGGSVSMRGTGEPGAQITIREQGRTTVLGTTRVLQSSTWNLTTTNVDARKVTLEATQQGKGRNTTLATVTLNPEAAPSTPITLTNPNAAQIATGYTPNTPFIFRGTARPDAYVRIENTKGFELATVKTSDQGLWEWTRANMGTYTWSLRFIADPNTDRERTTTLSGFKPAPQDITLTNPTPAQIAAGYTPNTSYVFRGTARPDAPITIRNLKGLPLAHVTATARGDWSWNRTNMGTYTWSIDFIQDDGTPDQKTVPLRNFAPRPNN